MISGWYGSWLYATLSHWGTVAEPELGNCIPQFLRQKWTVGALNPLSLQRCICDVSWFHLFQHRLAHQCPSAAVCTEKNPMCCLRSPGEENMWNCWLPFKSMMLLCGTQGSSRSNFDGLLHLRSFQRGSQLHKRNPAKRWTHILSYTIFCRIWLFYWILWITTLTQASDLTKVHDPSASSGNLLPPHVAGLMAAGDCGLHSSKCCCHQENTIHQSVLLSFHMLQAG